MDRRVLIVDDDPSMLRLLQKYLIDDGYKVFSADNGAEALCLIVSEGLRIVIADWMMPEMNGLELCRAIRSSKEIGFTYILIMTAYTTKDRLVEAFEAGADDFLSKPLNREECRARLNAGVRITRMQEELTRHNQALYKANEELAVLNNKLERMATIDALTGLANRRMAMTQLAEHWSMTERHDQPLSCILFDIDHFKHVNDTYGHDVGDVVLRETAQLLTRFTRAGEVACRLGGEEFLILCPSDTAQMVAAGAERLRQAVESNKIRCNDFKLNVTVSAGVAQRGKTIHAPMDLLKHADEAMYAAKRSGRNRVCVTDGGDPVLFPKPCHEQSDAQSSCNLPMARSAESLTNVMVVDDDANTRALCRRFLEQAGYKVTEAADGCDALAKTSSGKTDVIIMDAMMPNMDGLECARRLKANPATRDIPIIMASARTQQKDIVAGLEAKADEYITKPIRQKEFILRVRSMSILHRRNLELFRANEIQCEQARSLGLLLDLSQSLVATKTLDIVLEKIISTTAKLTHSRRVSIMLPDAENRFLTIARAIGIEEQIATSISVPVGGAIAGRVFQLGEPVVINTPAEAQNQQYKYDSRFFASVPLVSKALCSSDHVVGVLNITERLDERPFLANELEYLDLISNIAASAIDDIATRRARDEAQDSIVVALAKLAEYRDESTGRHLERVTEYALILAKQLRTTDQFRATIDACFLHDLERAMPLHDIGKVAIPDQILHKPGKLNPEEMEQMRRHTEVGAETIRSVATHVPDVGFIKMAEEIAWAHHEWYDGRGEPRGLNGCDIPLPARIAAVADVYDALTTERVYKNASTHGEATAIIQAGCGLQFDPVVVDAFLKCEKEYAKVAADFADVHQKDEGVELAMT